LKSEDNRAGLLIEIAGPQNRQVILDNLISLNLGVILNVNDQQSAIDYKLMFESINNLLPGIFTHFFIQNLQLAQQEKRSPDYAIGVWLDYVFALICGVAYYDSKIDPEWENKKLGNSNELGILDLMIDSFKELNKPSDDPKDPEGIIL